MQKDRTPIASRRRWIPWTTNNANHRQATVKDLEHGSREGSLDAPTRHPLDWNSESFYSHDSLFAELERVFDICHGCRRCFSLCNTFPTLFDLIDESDTGEIDGVDKKAYWDVVDHCYLCDLCYMTKCPYVPPHEWNVDFPHLMLRAKAVRYKEQGARTRDKILASTDALGRLAGIPVVAQTVNAVNRNGVARKLLEKTLGVHASAPVPKYTAKPFRRRPIPAAKTASAEIDNTRGRVALYTTCYCNYNEPDIAADLVAVLQHNGIEVRLPGREQCCGMPRLELGDLGAVKKAKDVNVPELVDLVDQGWDIIAPVPSCVLMFKQELPLMFPDDENLAKVARAFFDPFEYLMLRHKDGVLNRNFKKSLGKIAYHVACHLRVQNMGLKTRDILKLVPDTEIIPIERCSGHDGTYAVKKEFYDIAKKIARPVVRKVESAEADYYASDCPMAGHQIENSLQVSKSGSGFGEGPTHPITLLRIAYGI